MKIMTALLFLPNLIAYLQAHSILIIQQEE